MSQNIEINGKIYPCTVSLAMDLVGGKWKSVILYHLKAESKRYNELRKEIPSITDMTLSIQLKQLEESGLISRQASGDKPPIKVTYHLSDFGKTFLPALDAINDWGRLVARAKGMAI